MVQDIMMGTYFILHIYETFTALESKNKDIFYSPLIYLNFIKFSTNLIFGNQFTWLIAEVHLIETQIFAKSEFCRFSLVL